MSLSDITTLGEYMTTYGPLLGRQAQENLQPLHVPSRDAPSDLSHFKRPLYAAQAHTCEAAVKQLRRSDFVYVCAEMGTGKTIISMAIAEAHSRSLPYRALVFIPPHLASKWIREIHETIPGVETHTIESYHDVASLDPSIKPTRSEWWIIKETSAKFTADRAVATFRRHGKSRRRREFQSSGDRHRVHDFVLRKMLYCPQCGAPLIDKKGQAISAERLQKSRLSCQAEIEIPTAKPIGFQRKTEDGHVVLDHRIPTRVCGAALWTYISDRDCWAPARYIANHLLGYFDYLFIDEIHEEISPNSIRANAAGTLASAIRKKIGLSGSMFGGYAWHMRSLMLRMAPRSLVNEGYHWSNVTAFNQAYGRIETRIVETEKTAEECKRGRGTTNRTSYSSVKPGIMPSLFGNHLMESCVFLTLDEMAAQLPRYTEVIRQISMDSELADTYQQCENTLREQVRVMLQRKDRRLLSAMLNFLLAYPDKPYGWGPVGYCDRSPSGKRSFIEVLTPPSLDTSARAKEKALLRDIAAEHEQGRQCWVYVTFTDKHDVQSRIVDAIRKGGFKVTDMRSQRVPPAKREEWIRQHGPSHDVIVSHPQLVRTGVDLFDKKGSFNFPTIMFYETGYSIFTLRQAARRSYRLAQHLPCRVYFYYYAKTMQDRAMTLMGRKLAQSLALEGQFSEEGMAALGDEDDAIEIALARSLVNNMNDTDAGRVWSKVTQTFDLNNEPALPLGEPVAPPFVTTSRRRLTRPGLLFS